MDGPIALAEEDAPLTGLAERLAGREDRLAEAVLAAARALHGLVAELRPATHELRAALDFLAEVGQASDARRHEWVLLADVLGVTALAEDLRADPAATPATTAGPFYRPDAPDVPEGGSLSLDGVGEPLEVTARVVDPAGGPVPGAVVEVWHANGEGLYENQDPDRQPDHNLRGRLRADAEGRLRFRTVRPRGIRLPDDGPVGTLMRALSLPLERPAHLHLRVAAPGHAPLVTQVFDRDDPAIDRDPLLAVKPTLLHALRPRPGGGWVLDLTLTLGAPAPDATS